MASEKLPSLDLLPEGGAFELDGLPEAELLPERIVFLYVDYGTLYVEAGMKIWGNWGRLTSEACTRGRPLSFIRREDIRGYEFVMHCAYHNPQKDDGVYKFSIALGGP